MNEYINLIATTRIYIYIRSKSNQHTYTYTESKKRSSECYFYISASSISDNTLPPASSFKFSKVGKS